MSLFTLSKEAEIEQADDVVLEVYKGGNVVSSLGIDIEGRTVVVSVEITEEDIQGLLVAEAAEVLSAITSHFKGMWALSTHGGFTEKAVAEWLMHGHETRLPEVLRLLLIDDRDIVQSAMINAAFYRHHMVADQGGE
jgi:molybdopterin-binding protein